MDSDLARTIVALPGWAWQEGLLVVEAGVSGLHGTKGRVVPGTRGGWSVAWRIAFNGVMTTSITHGAVPVLDDPATGGALLAMLGEVSEYTDCFRVHADGGTHWEVYHCMPDGSMQPATGPTLGEACAAALCAIGRCA